MKNLTISDVHDYLTENGYTVRGNLFNIINDYINENMPGFYCGYIATLNKNGITIKYKDGTTLKTEWHNIRGVTL